MDAASFPFIELARLILRLYPLILFHPTYMLLFAAVMAIIIAQFRRSEAEERRLFGVVRTPAGPQALYAAAQGLLGGFIGSFLMVGIGVSLSESGISYVWLLALLLLSINPRFICFSYAGGIISLVSLITGWPRLSIPGLLALVAILHITESLLIISSGHMGAIPMYIDHQAEGRPVGAFNLRRFWPVPIAALKLTQLAELGPGYTTVAMPAWWPLIKFAAEPAPGKLLVPEVFLVVAALGYADIAVARGPRAKTARTAGLLMAFSLILLGLSVAASRLPAFMWLAALFAPLGHEAVIYLGVNSEVRRPPVFKQPPAGVMVMATVAGGAAHRLGLKAGDIVTAVNGQPVGARADMSAAMAAAGTRLKVAYRRDGEARRAETCIGPEEAQGGILGILPAPAPGDESHGELRTRVVLGAFWERVWKWLKGRFGGY